MVCTFRNWRTAKSWRSWQPAGPRARSRWSGDDARSSPRDSSPEWGRRWSWSWYRCVSPEWLVSRTSTGIRHSARRVAAWRPRLEDRRPAPQLARSSAGTRGTSSAARRQSTAAEALCGRGTILRFRVDEPVGTSRGAVSLGDVSAETSTRPEGSLQSEQIRLLRSFRAVSADPEAERVASGVWPGERGPTPRPACDPPAGTNLWLR